MYSLVYFMVIKKNPKEVRKTVFIGILSFVSMMKSILGPQGREKLIYGLNKNIVKTKCIFLISKNLVVKNPVTLLFQDFVKSLEKKIGSEMNAIVVLIGNIIFNSNFVYKNDHEIVKTIKGLRLAMKIGISSIDANSKIILKNLSKNALFWWVYNSCKTILKTSISNEYVSYFSKLTMIALLKYNKKNILNDIKIIKVLGGDGNESFLDQGIVLKNIVGITNDMFIENARSFILSSVEMNKTPSFLFKDNKLKTIEFVKDLKNLDHQNLHHKTQSLTNAGYEMLLTKDIIYETHEKYLKQKNILFIDNLDLKSIEKISYLVSASISTINNSLEKYKMGKIKMIFLSRMQEKQFIVCKGTENIGCSLVLRGRTKDEIIDFKRSVFNSLRSTLISLKDLRFMYAGGCTEVKVIVLILANK
mmetsp:Transcript_21030/g.29483  ORF Transcript_21030/g.29483 Transcript_21030/m.29483 type:complete len:418 (-) Transcript_21030:917-2170(-)